MSSIAENIQAIQQRICQLAHENQRDPNTITLIAVTKTHPVAAIEAAIAAGLSHFGENYIKEAELTGEFSKCARKDIRSFKTCMVGELFPDFITAPGKRDDLYYLGVEALDYIYKNDFKRARNCWEQLQEIKLRTITED